MYTLHTQYIYLNALKNTSKPGLKTVTYDDTQKRTCKKTNAI